MVDRAADVLARYRALPAEMREVNVVVPLYKRTETGRLRVLAYAKSHREKHPLLYRTSSRIRSFLRCKSAKKASRTIKYLGCTQEEYRHYITAKFTRGMTWAKLLAGKIHIDHIIPVSWFDETEWEMRVAFHFTNTQPMWAKDNLRKGNRIKAAQPDLFAGVK